MEITITLDKHGREGAIKWTCIARRKDGQVVEVVEGVEPIFIERPEATPACAIASAAVSLGIDRMTLS